MQYVGHRRKLPSGYADDLLLIALEKLEKPELAYDFITAHAELLIHPQALTITKFQRHFMQKEQDYEKIKEFFEVVKGKYLLPRPLNFFEFMIERAIQEDDKETAIEAYLAVLWHEKEITKQETYSKVFDCMTFDETIDNVLFYDLKKRIQGEGSMEELQDKRTDLKPEAKDYT